MRTSNPLKVITVFMLIILQGGCKYYYYRPWQKIKACGTFEQVSFQPDTVPWHLVVISSPTCGFCWRAKAQFARQNVAERIPTTWVEYDPPSQGYMEKATANNWYSHSNMLLLNDCHSQFELFPTFILYRKGKSRPVWIHRGWDPDVIPTLLAKTKDN